MGRYHREGESNVVVGVRGICRYAVMGPKTFYSLHRDHDFPAMHLPDGRWYTTKTLIDEWVRASWKAEQAARKATQGKELTTSGN